MELRLDNFRVYKIMPIFALKENYILKSYEVATFIRI